MIYKPIIKWVGGKTQIIDKIMENFPTEINNYHELFLGGGSVLIALLSMKDKIKINGSINAYDINETLINMYINIRDRPLEIYKYLKKLIYHFNNIIEEKGPRNIKHIKDIKSKESFYYWTRYKFNKLKDKKTIKSSALFIFLNKTCFRGLYREGPNGFNVPYGHYNNRTLFQFINKKHLMDISKLIQNVNFYHMSFEVAFNKISFNDFLYLDPPYAPINNTSFVGYVEGGFDLDKHKLLFGLIKKGHKFMMSNADVELVRENFNSYNIMTILCKRSINSKNPESKVNEVLIKNY
jgi:DNA adenine methylase